MRRFWLMLLLCLPTVGWAQFDEPTPAPVPIDTAPSNVAVEPAPDPAPEEVTPVEADVPPEEVAETPVEADVPPEEVAETPVEEGATAGAIKQIEAAVSAETLTDAERKTLSEALAEVEQVPGPWSGDIAFGFLSTTGSSEATTYNSKLGLIYSGERFKNDFSFNAIYGEQDNIRSVERYALINQSDYNINERDFAFLALDAEKDLFGAIRERTSQTVGYGRRLLLGPVHTLNVQGGGGSRQQLPQDGGGRDYDFILRVSADYRWKISETSSFSQKLRLETGVENTFTEAISELKLNIIGNVSANLSFTARDNSLSSFDSSRTDTFTAVNLGYQFGK